MCSWDTHTYEWTFQLQKHPASHLSVILPSRRPMCWQWDDYEGDWALKRIVVLFNSADWQWWLNDSSKGKWYSEADQADHGCNQFEHLRISAGFLLEQHCSSEGGRLAVTHCYGARRGYTSWVVRVGAGVWLFLHSFTYPIWWFQGKIQVQSLYFPNIKL